ncbi:succinate--CoA ligase subunit alpha, partial [Streptomyces sp. SID5926]|nr:succinate--CoA ligase subunit alpha [Streptomyces sp. SID5926]
AGAIVSGSSGTARAKKEALESAGVRVGSTPTETARHVLEALDALDARAGAAQDGAARDGARA